MSWILSYGCTSAAGTSTENFWQGLLAGVDHSRDVEPLSWRQTPAAQPQMRAYVFQSHDRSFTQRQLLNQQLMFAWKEAAAFLSENARRRLQNGKKLGVILASTKGFIDDVIWSAEKSPQQDTLGGLLQDFLQSSDLQAVRTTCVSNACASGLGALYLAEKWLQAEIVDDVIVLSADSVGSFVLHGFQSLRVITTDKVRPFSGERSGFYLGEAATAIVLSRHAESDSLYLRGVGIDAEGFAVTRPSQSGDSIQRAIQRILPSDGKNPDVIIAHATATAVNDQVEDNTFRNLFFAKGLKPLITATKWSVGHTLGVSGSLDFIAGCEILKRQKIFSIANTPQTDSQFAGSYLVGTHGGLSHEVKSFMNTSLGFGGLHAAAWVEKRVSA